MMTKTFLQHVAQHILNKYGNDLSDVAVVFPNKRAALFLNHAIAECSDKPIWSPAYITISDLFRQHSKLTVADPIKLIVELHKSFVEVTGKQETLDQFYGWGQLLLADFDDIDKNDANAEHVFRNLRDYHEYDDVSYLTDEQKSILIRFFSNFHDSESTLQKRFLELWSKLYDVYINFKQRLADQGLAYEGMLYNEVVKQEQIDFVYHHYLFVGFNMVQKVEQILFKMLKQKGKAAFYWDFDHYYLPSSHSGKVQSSLLNTIGHEAGVYIGQYLDKFPNELDNQNQELYNNLRNEKQITFISASTENIQAKYVTEWILSNEERIKGGNKTAIVLCDENLLQSVIHCIPPQVEHVNITTGYPLQQAPIASLIQQLIILQHEGFAKRQNAFRLHYINQMLRHPYASFISPAVPELWKKLNGNKAFYVPSEELCKDEGLSLLFSIKGLTGITLTDNYQLLEWLKAITKRIAQNGRSMATEDPLREESLFRMYTLLNRLSDLIQNEDVVIDKITLNKLIRQLINSTTVPFHGEPANGLQVMGVLETRNLDFDHVIILSCNEGNIPKGVDDSSFIPHALRKAYDLTTIDNKVAIYSYYFHRLIQRAKDVTILYNNSTEGTHTCEMSRFMLQLLVELGKPIRRLTLNAGMSQIRIQTENVIKDNRVMERLQSIRSLSPSAIIRYMRCPLSFFYQYIANITEPDLADEDHIDNRIFGNIFHRAAQLMYEKLLPSGTKQGIDGMIQSDDINKLLNNPKSLDSVISQAFSEELFNLPEGTVKHPQLNGLQLINREVINTYLRQLLRVDLKLVPFRVLSHEEKKSRTINVNGQNIQLSGRIDRLDEVSIGTANHHLRVVDYKTGFQTAKDIKTMEEVFYPQNIRTKHSDYIMQALFYSLLVAEEYQKPVSPALLFIQRANAEDFSPVLTLEGNPIIDVKKQCGDAFKEQLQLKINEIFDPQLPFSATQDTGFCTSCPYKEMCGR